MRLAAIMLLFKEQAFVEASIRAIYPVVDSICCATARDRNYAGKPLDPDRSIETLLEIPDPENKLRLLVQRDWRDVPGQEAGSNAEIFVQDAAARHRRKASLSASSTGRILTPQRMSLETSSRQLERGARATW